MSKSWDSFSGQLEPRPSAESEREWAAVMAEYHERLARSYETVEGDDLRQGGAEILTGAHP